MVVSFEHTPLEKALLRLLADGCSVLCTYICVRREMAWLMAVWLPRVARARFERRLVAGIDDDHSLDSRSLSRIFFGGPLYQWPLFDCSVKTVHTEY